MGHDAVRELLALAALDALSPSDRKALEAHARSCETCTRELAEMRDSVASIGAALPARPLAPERGSLIRARLMGRAVASARKYWMSDAVVHELSSRVTVSIPGTFGFARFPGSGVFSARISGSAQMLIW